MTLDQVTSLLLFAFALSITPGPNNLMLLACGANFGFYRSIHAVLGVGLGLFAMMMVMGAGLIKALDYVPGFQLTLQVLCTSYLLYLVWKIASAAAPNSEQSNRKPISFLQGIVLELINPKAWIMATSSIALHTPSNSLEMITLVTVIFAIVHFPCLIFWVVLGNELRRIITGNSQLRIFNGALAALLLVSITPMIMSMGGDFGAAKIENPLQNSLVAVNQWHGSIEFYFSNLEMTLERQVSGFVASINSVQSYSIH